MIRFFQELFGPVEHPQWDENEVVMRSKYHKFRLFRAQNPKPDECAVIYPPYAGRHGNVTSNLIRLCQEEGLDTYVFDLLPIYAGNTLTLEKLVGLAKECYRFPDRKKHVFGTCMGQWLSFLAVNGEEPPIDQFAFAGPADFSAGDGYIKRGLRTVPFWTFYLPCALSGGVNPAWVQWWRFTMGNPIAVFFEEPMKLLKCVMDGDEKGIQKWRRNRNWYYSPLSLGWWFLDVVKDFFIDNRFKEVISWDKFTWPLHIHVGEDDEITVPQQTLVLKDWVKGKVAVNIHKKCGHTKCFTGRKELESVRAALRGQACFT